MRYSYKITISRLTLNAIQLQTQSEKSGRLRSPLQDDRWRVPWTPDRNQGRQHKRTVKDQERYIWLGAWSLCCCRSKRSRWSTLARIPSFHYRKLAVIASRHVLILSYKFLCNTVRFYLRILSFCYYCESTDDERWVRLHGARAILDLSLGTQVRHRNMCSYQQLRLSKNRWSKCQTYWPRQTKPTPRIP